MRVAVMADIHGNLPALDAVLGDIDAVGVDAIVLNGDLAGNAYDGAVNPDLPEVARAPTEYCAARTTTPTQLPKCSALPHRNIPDWRNSSKRMC